MIFICAVLAIVYLIFLVWLCFGMKTMDGRIRVKSQIEPPPVSIIVAARDEEKTIGRLLNCLVEQTFPKPYLEIIVTVDNSSDSTGTIVESFSHDFPYIKCLIVNNTPSDWSPKMWALSKGVQASKGEILLFTDADCIMGPEWINSLISCFKDPDVGLVAGPSPLERSNRFWDRMLLLDSIGQDALTAGGFARGIGLTSSGRNRAIRRAVYTSIQGFQSIKSFFSGDDDLMMHRISCTGWKALFCIKPHAEVKSEPPQDCLEFIKQRLRFASKGKVYYRLPFVTSIFKLVLTMIYLTNLGVVFGLITFIITFKSIWLLPWFVKMIGDGILISRYLSMMDRLFDPRIFFYTELWHSFYIVAFGTFGSFLPISWKGRKRRLQKT